MKPEREASGVRSSWLALARKSTRDFSARRESVSSRKWTRASRVADPLAWSGEVRTCQIRSCTPRGS